MPDQALRHAYSAEAWEHGGSELGRYPVAGAFAGTELAALAGYELWGEHIAHIAVITHPARRGLGFARMAVGAIAALALERGLIPQYRTLTANAASLAVAHSLGFHHYATSLALRLHSTFPT